MTTALSPHFTAFDPESLRPLVAAWAESRTDLTAPRAYEIAVGKTDYVMEFFAHTCKPPQDCTSSDVLTWIETLRERELAEATIYARCSRLSAFYNWVAKNGSPLDNPVTMVRPKAPKPYQSDKTKALTDDQMRGILRMAKALSQDAKSERRRLAATRNYVMLQMYFASGLRREEIAQLTWGKVTLTQTGMVIETRLKGGETKQIEIAQPSIREALLAYTRATGQDAPAPPSAPLWLAHMNNQMTEDAGRAVSSRAVAQSFTLYAARLGVPDAHMHMTRHTFARIVAEESGSMVVTQDALGHKKSETTRAYVDRLGIKRDRFSDKIMARLNS